MNDFDTLGLSDNTVNLPRRARLNYYNDFVNGELKVETFQTLDAFDDDGEPNGTAGRPILNVLQHKSIGNVIIIVVRYFGGIKLGAGGLTRAYAGSAQAAVDEMVLLPYVPMAQVQIIAEFATEAQCRYVVEDLGGHIDDVTYSKQVTLTVTLAEADIDHLKERLAMDGRVLESP